MALIFILLTQLINLTTLKISFEVFDDRRRFLPELPPGKTRFAKQSRVLRRLRDQSDPNWKIRVCLDGEFTGIELDPRVMLKYVRVEFRVDDADVLCVDGVPENRGTDVLLRHRYFGCMRNFYWNCRPIVPIIRSDSQLATKLRNLEGCDQHLSPVVDITLQKRYASPPKQSPGKNTPFPPKDDKNKEDIIKFPPAQQPRSRIDPRPLGPPVRFGEQTSIDDNENDNVTTVGQQVRPRNVPRYMDPSGRPGEQTSTSSPQSNVRDVPQPLNHPANAKAANQQVRLRDVPQQPLDHPTNARVANQQVSSPRPRDINSPQSNARAANQHVRPRDVPRPLDPQSSAGAANQQVRPRDAPRPLVPPGRPRGQTNTDDKVNSPQPNIRATGQQVRPPMDSIGGNEIRPNGTATAQQARARDDESSTNHNVVEKDSFVHGIILVLSLVICILINFLF